MEVLCRGVGVLVASFRVSWAWALAGAAPFSWGLFGFVWAEMLIGVLAIANSFLAKRVDASWGGVIAMFAYAVGFIAVPTAEVTPLLDATLFVCAMVRVGLIAYLGFSASLGVPTHYKTVTGGPYRIVRHPIQATSVVVRGVFLLANPCIVNLITVLCSWINSWVIVLMEEDFLDKVPSWRAYAVSVRWRLIPLVW